jgi:hypothetical protein
MGQRSERGGQEIVWGEDNEGGAAEAGEERRERGRWQGAHRGREVAIPTTTCCKKKKFNFQGAPYY